MSSMDDLEQLKATLRALVVSSPTQMDLRTLLRDYRYIVGAEMPIAKYGYRKPVEFLREKCADSFLFHGPASNPVLTLIVPDSIKYLDYCVRNQKLSPIQRLAGRRRSVRFNTPCLIADSYKLRESKPKPGNIRVRHTSEFDDTEEINESSKIQEPKNCYKSKMQSFFKKKMAILREQTDDESGKLTDSSRVLSSRSLNRIQFEELKSEVKQLIFENPEGVWCTDIISLYRERYQRELNCERFGYTNIPSFVSMLAGEVIIRPAHNFPDWLLLDPTHAPHVPTDTVVFPEDCMQFMESIPKLSLDELGRGDYLEVKPTEVYSPSHFWFMRLGDQYDIAMDDLMDEMTKYYSRGAGKERKLAARAVLAGHYCSCLYANDWHRALIVKIIDDDTVKVRYVDYGTVDTVSAASLKPLLRCWGELPAQALRGRLAAVRPPAAGLRWPRASAAHFLRLVSNRKFIAGVVSLDRKEKVLEVVLVDTSTEVDRSIGADLVRAGHADALDCSTLHALDSYLYPRFDALESGSTLNYAEIYACMRDGIELDFVDEYRLHVPGGPRRHPAFLTRLTSATTGLTPYPASSVLSPTTPPLELVDREPSFLSNSKVEVSEPTLLPSSPVASTSELDFPVDTPATSVPETVSSENVSASLATVPVLPARALPVSPPASLKRMPPPPRVPHVFAPPNLVPTPSMQFGPMSSGYGQPPLYFAPPPHFYPLPRFVPLPPTPAPPAPVAWPVEESAQRIRTVERDVTLSMSECEIIRVLSQVDANAAYCYMLDVLARHSITPPASECRLVSAVTQTDGDPTHATAPVLVPTEWQYMRLPPGFGDV